MPTVFDGTYTLKEVLQLTKRHFPTRFEYYERDVVKSHVRVVAITSYDPDRRRSPRRKYEIVTKSWPQYPPYYTGKDKRGRPVAYQRSHPHFYRAVLQMDRLSINTKHWKYRLGTGRRVRGRKPPQSQIHSIYRENLKRWSRKKIRAHRRKRHKYLDWGDYVSKALGVNLDWQMRAAYAYHVHGHLFGRVYDLERHEDNPRNIPFAPKHLIGLVNGLLRQGVLKDD